MMPRAVDAVLFDFDGTLADSEAVVVSAIAEAFRSEGYVMTEAHVRDMRRSTTGPASKTLRLMQGPLSAAEFERVSTSFSTLLAARLPLIQPIPGAAALIDALAAHDVVMALVTNRGEASVVHQIAAFGWQARLSTIVHGQSVPQPKPSPEPALHALRLLGVPPERAALVGDAEDDMSCGRAAGLPLVIALTGRYQAASLRAAGATHAVNSLDEVLPLLLAGGASS